jgi:hypothetical protein
LDCEGEWGKCEAECKQYYSVTQWPQGNGAGCTIGDFEDRPCDHGVDDCPRKLKKKVFVHLTFTLLKEKQQKKQLVKKTIQKKSLKKIRRGIPFL